MSLVLDSLSGVPLLSKTVEHARWTVIIAAAGRGSRLGFDRPKILFPVGGLTILERLVNLFLPFCLEFVFVLSPDGYPVVEPYLRKYLPARARVALQPRPLGMADAVACGLPEVRTENSVVVWGDQLALKPTSIDYCTRLLEGPAMPEAVCPTLLRVDPYIHFVRDPQSARILSVLQAREGDILPKDGESDSGIFFFRSSAIFRHLPVFLQSPSAMGRRTGEQNFLPIFPLIDRIPGALITPRIMTEVESTGVNSPEDAVWLETHANL